ncbi:Transmembrane protein [Parasponia andersonii]|uniref:Transmembrane protein n=1 Tax=Parasponia andersonii TaxID=3476 RepID=A0A2P5BZE0_PARAD|nr:Transmembrane protein [Parasponia andersonii]
MALVKLFSFAYSPEIKLETYQGLAVKASTLNLIKVLSESRRIIKGQLRLFVTLSFLFILPFSIAATVYPIIQSPFPDAISKSFLNLIGFGPQRANDQVITISTKTVLLALAYILFTVVFFIFAIVSITYSTYSAIHGFPGQPIKLKSATKSITTSSFPLLGTTLLAQTIVSEITILFVIVLALLITGARQGFQIEFSLPYFILLCVDMLLKRSASLIRGRRSLALSLSFLFAFCYGVIAWSAKYSLPVEDLDGRSTRTSVTNHEWKCLMFGLAVKIFLNSAFRTLVVLYEMVVTTVLYVFCNKAIVRGDE